MKNFFVIISALISLTRPLNVLIAIVAVTVGGLLSGFLDRMLIIAAISAGLVLAGENAINDFFDFRTDLINHPTRPIPLGIISRSLAFWVGLILILIGICFSWHVGLSNFIIALILSIFLFVYSAFLSRTPIIGNFIVAFAGGITLIYGAIPGDYVSSKTIWAAIIAFGLHFAREIFKDIEDRLGDEEDNRKTLPIVTNPKKAAVFGFIGCVLSMLFIEIPYMFRVFGDYYQIVALLPFLGTGIAGVLGIQGYVAKSQMVLKISMLLGIVALIVEYFFPGK